MGAFSIVVGAAVGMLVWYSLSDLLRGVVSTDKPWMMITAAILGAFGTLMSRRLMEVIVILTAAMLGAVAVTPLVQWLVLDMLVSDELEHADAIVALHGAGGRSFAPNVTSDRRLMYAWLLYGQQWVPTLVVSVGEEDVGVYEATVRSQLRTSGPAPRLEFLTPGTDTHDEALDTAQLARNRGWTRIILVTDPLHMRRAAGLSRPEGDAEGNGIARRQPAAYLLRIW
jgi:uncharacterized SAM-binding protein YcdF (DUF218 family)